MRCALLLLLTGRVLAQGVVVVGHPEAEEPAAFVDTVHADGDPAAQVDLADVVEGATGASVRRTGSAGRPATLSLRGGTGQQLAVFLDDIPLHGGRGGAFDLASVPPVYVDRVEVLRGPAAATLGSGAQGGALRLRTREAGEGLESLLRARLGSGALAQLDGAVTAGDGARDLLLAGALSAAEGDFRYEDVNGAARRRRGNDHLRGGGLARARAPWLGGGLTLLVEGTAAERGEPGSEQVDPTPDARSEDARLQGAAAWRGPAGPAELELRAFGRGQRYAFDDPTPLLGPSHYAVRDQAWGGRLGVGRRISGHHLGAAVEGRHDRAETEGDGARTERRGAADVTLADTWRPWGWLALSGAARGAFADDRGGVLVPGGGLAVGPFAGLSVRANAGRFFRDASFDELYFRGQGIEGNPELRPEDGWGWDVGLRWSWARRLSLEAVLFEQRYRRLILFVPRSAYLVEATDAFGATVRGVEAGASARFGRLRLSGRYLGLDHAFDEAPHNPLPFRPAHAFDAGAAWTTGAAVVHGRFAWRGQVFSDRLGHRTLPAYGRLDVGVRGPVAPGVEVGMELRNALDEQGRDAVHQPLPGRTWLLLMGYEG